MDFSRYLRRRESDEGLYRTRATTSKVWSGVSDLGKSLSVQNVMNVSGQSVDNEKPSSFQSVTEFSLDLSNANCNDAFKEDNRPIPLIQVTDSSEVNDECNHDVNTHYNTLVNSTRRPKLRACRGSRHRNLKDISEPDENSNISSDETTTSPPVNLFRKHEHIQEKSPQNVNREQKGSISTEISKCRISDSSIDSNRLSSMDTESEDGEDNEVFIVGFQSSAPHQNTRSKKRHLGDKFTLPRKRSRGSVSIPSVTFADEVGLPLVNIKVFEADTDEDVADEDGYNIANLTLDALFSLPMRNLCLPDFNVK